MSIEKLLDFVVNSVRNEKNREWERLKEGEDVTRWTTPNTFWVYKPAGDLVEPSRKKAEHHRLREKHYTQKLEEAEKELREKGVSIELFDPTTNTYQHVPAGSIASGAIGMGWLNQQTGGALVAPNAAQLQSLAGSLPQFQPRVDQRLADNAKNAKMKMLEHREKAFAYEKFARAFALDSERKVRLTVEDIHYFGLGD